MIQTVRKILDLQRIAVQEFYCILLDLAVGTPPAANPLRSIRSEKATGLADPTSFLWWLKNGMELGRKMMDDQFSEGKGATKW
ncbi:hypothetical protein COLO4_20786 [Corchorus olitorius]|uniref:Uncharacterized protein n=1 Tax=Corchorus olitorius TaxID=93759 RepID=A0A1R3IX10_9ROSI|nr:hypothetical protein COLO4_20786 [Corchorus olitorius]